MAAVTIALETMITQRCRACGTPHRIRAATAPGPAAAGCELVGFFGICPETGFREWLVVEVPGWREGARVVAFGPPDDDTWEPLDLEALERIWRNWSAPPNVTPPGPLVSFHPRSARSAGPGDTLARLRAAIGETRAG